MTQQPNYRFTLITNLDKIPTLGTVGVEWTDLGGAAPWANVPPIISCVAPALASNILRRPLAVIPGNEYIVTINYTATQQCQFIVSTGTGQNIYLLNAPASTVPKILRFSFKGYPNSGQFIYLQVVNASPSTSFNLNTLNVAEVETMRRVIQPGGWKSLSKLSDRLLNLWGFSETLEGNVELVGADFEWMKDLLIPQPDRLFSCLVEIDDGVGYETYFKGLLDTNRLITPGIGHTYRASLAFLKESAWSEFVSRLSTPLNTASKQGVTLEDVLDGRVSRPAFPGDNIWPRLRMRYVGGITAIPSTTLTADAIINLGFGELVTINDGFNSFVGTSSQPSVNIEVGKIKAITGTIRVLWTAGAQVFVEAVLTDAGTWVTLNSGTTYNINITDALLITGTSSWTVRVRNASGATRTFQINGAQLNFDTHVEYQMRPSSRAPIITMKAYTSRIMGEYDNLRSPVFDDAMAGSGRADPNIPMQDPPPRFTPYNQGASLIPIVGNYFAGGTVNWTRLLFAPPRYECTGGLSNILLIRAYDIDSVFASNIYVMKGDYALSLTAVISTPGLHFELVGLLDKEVFVIATYVSAGAPPSFIQVFFTLTRYYESLGIRLVAGSTGITFTLATFAYVTTPNVPRGKYALNYLTNGQALKLNTAPKGDTVSTLFIDFGQIFYGLAKVFSLGMEPEINEEGKVRIYMDEVTQFFLSGFGSYMYAEEFTVEVDETLLADSINVGGTSSNETTADKESSCSNSEFATSFITTKRRQDLSFGLCLNPATILNQKLGNDDVALLELVSNGAPLSGDTTRYRTTSGLTITGTQSPRQPNWLHNEGRILRRNNAIVSSMGTPYFYMISSIAEQPQVDAGDGLGPVSGADPIIATPLFTPWLIKFETDMTYAEEKQLILNRKLVQRVNINGIERAFYLKSAQVNRSTGRGLIAGWLKASGDFSLDFSDDFEVTPIPVEI